MQKLLLPFLLSLSVVTTNAFVANNVLADDAEEVKAIKENPNDAKALNAYLGTKFRKISGLIRQDANAAEKELSALKELLGELEPEDQDAQAYVTRGKSAVRYFEDQLELARVTIEQLEKKLSEDANDTKSIGQYISKVSREVGMIARGRPDEADKKLQAAKEFLASLKEDATDPGAKAAIESSTRSFARLESTIESGKKLAVLVGKDAAELKIDDWVNGSPLTDSDLKGKVVLLDFWAVWCGPCIATFPHLREWHDKYSDEGLVIIGLTRYYSYTWDDAAGRGVKSTEEVSPEDEQEMLEKFAEYHKLQHRFAIQSDRTLSEFYAVSGIPHVVVIDREGKIRIIRVGSGEQNAHDVEEAIKQAIAAE